MHDVRLIPVHQEEPKSLDTQDISMKYEIMQKYNYKVYTQDQFNLET